MATESATGIATGMQESKQLPQVEAEMLLLTNTVNELSQKIRELEDRLSVVLRPIDEAQAEAKEDVELVALAALLRGNTNNIVSALKVLGRIMHYIEL